MVAMTSSKLIFDLALALKQGGEVPGHAIEELNALKPHENAIDLKHWVFLKPLIKQLEKREHLSWENLYLTNFEFPQINLFNILANHMPLVSLTEHIASSLLLEAIRNEPRCGTVLDIGIGSGQQMVKLMNRLAQIPGHTKKIRIIGIEPASESLAKAEKDILESAKSNELEVHFIGINKCTEDLNEEDWSLLKRHTGELIINEAFALHHIRFHETLHDLKQEALGRLRSLNPRLFVLSEPNSDHHTGDFLARIENCWKHFGLVFDVIDKSRMSDEEKNALKFHFFAREIEDIAAFDNNNRSERHESVDMWIQRLKEAGFTPKTSGKIDLNNKPDWLEISYNTDHIGLGLAGEVIVSVISVA